MADGDFDTKVPVTDQVREWIRVRDSFTKTELAVRFRTPGMSDRDFGLLMHKAFDELLEQGIAYSPRFGAYRRADSSQASSRSRNFTRAFYRKGERAVKLARIAAETATDPEDKARLERAALKRENALVTAKAAQREAVKARPRGV